MRMRFEDALCIPIGRILLAAAASGAVLVRAERAGSSRRLTVRRHRERAPTQTDCGPHAACRRTGPRHCMDPISCGERAYRTSVRDRRAQRISTDRASAHTHRRPGWKRVTTIQLAWRVCRPVSIRCLSSWSTLNTTYSMGARSAGRR